MNVCNLFNTVQTDYRDVGTWRGGYAIYRDAMTAAGINYHEGYVPEINGINVFFKHFAMPKFLEWMHEFGGVFVTDEHLFYDEGSPFHDKDRVEYCTRMTRMADVVVAASSEYVEAVEERTGVKPMLVPVAVDTFLFDEAPVEYRTGAVCWYGHENNIKSLVGIKFPCTIDIISHLVNTRGLKTTKGIGIINFDFKSKITKHLKWYDIVALPYKNTRAIGIKPYYDPNRVLCALYAGKIVVTDAEDMIEKYGLHDSVILATNVGEGVEWVRHNVEAALAKTKIGQRIVKETYMPEHVAKYWIAVYEKAQERTYAKI